MSLVQADNLTDKADNLTDKKAYIRLNVKFVSK